MRELTRSMASFSWAMSMFGVEQMANIVSPRRAADAFGAVARCTQGTLGPTLRSAFETGDRLQGAVIDFSFGLVGLGPKSGSAPANGAGSGQSAASGAAAAASGVLTQVGNLAFGLLQTGINTVYNVTGTAWQQQQGLSGWGPVQPPKTSAQQ